MGIPKIENLITIVEICLATANEVAGVQQVTIIKFKERFKKLIDNLNQIKLALI